MSTATLLHYFPRPPPAAAAVATSPPAARPKKRRPPPAAAATQGGGKRRAVVGAPRLLPTSGARGVWIRSPVAIDAVFAPSSPAVPAPPTAPHIVDASDLAARLAPHRLDELPLSERARGDATAWFASLCGGGAPSSCLVIAGPSGSGKTTLARLVVGAGARITELACGSDLIGGDSIAAILTPLLNSTRAAFQARGAAAATYNAVIVDGVDELDIKTVTALASVVRRARASGARGSPRVTPLVCVCDGAMASKKRLQPLLDVARVITLPRLSDMVAGAIVTRASRLLRGDVGDDDQDADREWRAGVVAMAGGDARRLTTLVKLTWRDRRSWCALDAHRLMAYNDDALSNVAAAMTLLDPARGDRVSATGVDRMLARCDRSKATAHLASSALPTLDAYHVQTARAAGRAAAPRTSTSCCALRVATPAAPHQPCRHMCGARRRLRSRRMAAAPSHLCCCMAFAADRAQLCHAMSAADGIGRTMDDAPPGFDTLMLPDEAHVTASLVTCLSAALHIADAAQPAGDGGRRAASVTPTFAVGASGGNGVELCDHGKTLRRWRTLVGCVDRRDALDRLLLIGAPALARAVDADSCVRAVDELTRGAPRHLRAEVTLDDVDRLMALVRLDGSAAAGWRPAKDARKQRDLAAGTLKQWNGVALASVGAAPQ